MLDELDEETTTEEGWEIFGAYDFGNFSLAFEGEKIFLAHGRTRTILSQRPVRGFRKEDFQGSREELEKLVGQENVHIEKDKPFDRAYVVYVIYE